MWSQPSGHVPPGRQRSLWQYILSLQTDPFGHYCKPPNWREYVQMNRTERHAYQWRDIVQFVRTQAKALGLPLFVLRYEDLCQSPRELITEVYKFAELRHYGDAVRQFPEKLQNMNFRIHKDLTLPEFEQVTQIQADELSVYGYMDVMFRKNGYPLD